MPLVNGHAACKPQGRPSVSLNEMMTGADPHAIAEIDHALIGHVEQPDGYTMTDRARLVRSMRCGKASSRGTGRGAGGGLSIPPFKVAGSSLRAGFALVPRTAIRAWPEQVVPDQVAVPADADPDSDRLPAGW
ncbi:MAG: hypothetical protein R3D52_07325 [Xanthobacteraceae bacterium]